MWYDVLENKRLWSIFEEISAIPRESGNEEGIRNWLVKWSEEHKLDVFVDKTGNVIIKAPATADCADFAPVALQGHMDMVCVKTAESAHDFTKDPIEVMTDGKKIWAKDTSLGADNGIAIALILDIISDPECSHGPVEAIFTVAEETGLTGAFGIDASLISSKRLINLDSEEEGVFYIGCAGGIEVDAEKKVQWTEAEGEAVSVRIHGLLGGHSGGEIHKERANAIKLMGRLLNRVPSFQIAALSGGTRRNVIPSECRAILTVKDADLFRTIAKNLERELKAEFAYSDPDIAIDVECAEKPAKALRKNASAKIADMLFISPAGVKSMSMSLKGVVETSDNLAICNLEEEKISVIWSVRSSVESSKLNLAYEIQALAENFGFKTVLNGDYPAWQPDVKSKFTKQVAAAYKKITGKKAQITAIHAGLECGILNKAIDGLDSLSLGPDLFDVHSVKEHVDVASAERIASFVKTMLKDMK